MSYEEEISALVILSFILIVFLLKLEGEYALFFAPLHVWVAIVVTLKLKWFMGFVEAVCISTEKGTIKKVVSQILLRQEWGIEGDAHAGDWHRQVSILAGESIDRMREKMAELDHGMFAENIVTRGIDLSGLIVGDSLRVGDAVLLEITQIGKECHNLGCAIKVATGECIMPKEGIFCRVVQGGIILPGMAVR